MIMLCDISNVFLFSAIKSLKKNSQFKTKNKKKRITKCFKFFYLNLHIIILKIKTMKHYFKSQKIVPFYFLIILIFALSGCSKKEQIKIGFLYTSDVTARFVMESAHFKEHAESLGANVIVDHADNNAAIQYEKAIEMMENGVELLALIAVNINTAENIVKEAKARNIPVLAYNRLISNCELDVYISGDNDQLGEDIAGFAINKKPEGNYIILNGDKFDRNAVELMASLEETLEPHIKANRINILYKTYIEAWNGDHAAYELDQVLAATPATIDAVISAYDGMSIPCIEVLEKYGLAGDVIVTGQDAEIESCRKIIEGTQHMTMYHPLKEIAYKAAEVAMDIVNGNDLEDKYDLSYSNNGLMEVPTVKIKSIVVTKNNIDEVLIESGFYERSQIY
jgi:D-xylose transport system substrate-binding protein